jgi:hypothetical protein|nr:MAG TPA: hypothetical protein [Caudoviricetes sp.]
MVAIKDFASNSVMGVVRKVVNYLCNTLTPKVDGAIDHLPARFNGTFNDSSRVLTMTIESQGTSTENLTAEVTIPAGGGSGGPTYSAGNGITITPENAIEIDTAVTATKQSVDTLQGQVGDAFSQVAIGADGKSLDFTALDGQVNNIVIPTNDGSDNWVEIDLNNWPNDFQPTDIIKVEFKKLKLNMAYSSGNDWTDTIYSINSIDGIGSNPNTVILTLDDSVNPLNYLLSYNITSDVCVTIAIYRVFSNYSFGSNLFDIRGSYFNGGNCKTTDVTISKTNLTNYVNRIWRKS